MENIDNIKVDLAPDASQKEKYKFKVVVVGDSGVGKTNLIKRFVTDVFKSDSKATVGVEFMSKSYLINDEVFKVEIWDTAGQERYKSMTKAYYKGAMGALVVYDITSEKSYESIEKWIGEIKAIANKNISINIIGNKCDLGEHRKVDTQTALSKSQQLNCAFLETSAKDATNVKQAFYHLLREMYTTVQPKISQEEASAISEGSHINTGEKVKVSENKPKDKVGCC